MTKKILNYQARLDKGLKVPRSAASYKAYSPDDLLKDLDRLPCNDWTRIQPYDPKTKSIVVQFFFDKGPDDGDNKETLEGPFLPNFHD